MERATCGPRVLPVHAGVDIPLRDVEQRELEMTESDIEHACGHPVLTFWLSQRLIKLEVEVGSEGRGRLAVCAVREAASWLAASPASLGEAGQRAARPQGHTEQPRPQRCRLDQSARNKTDLHQNAINYGHSTRSRLTTIIQR